jgi:hypothetical protein
VEKDKPMMHPDTELLFIDQTIGHGVFATRFIPCGTITWALDEFDQVLTPGRVAALAAAQRAQVEEYAYVDGQGNYILCWDLGRYVNHGCDPTSRGVGPAFEIAVRDVQPGEQLTSDYAELNITAAFQCRCGSPRCRGVVRADDLLRHGHEWDAVVAAAVLRLARVPQPLWPFVEGDEVLHRLRVGQGGIPPRRDYYVAAPAAPAQGAPETSLAPGLACGGLWRLADPAASA